MCPRVMMAGEHRADKEGECFVLVWAWWWPCSFRYNSQGKVVQGEREFRHSNLNGEIAETGLVGKVYPSTQSFKTYSNSPCPRVWMSYGMDLTISVLFSKDDFEKWF
jgi:hypothetical protein